MGRRRTGPASRAAGPARAFLLTLAVGLFVGLLLGFFLGRIGGNREQAAPPVPPARTVTVEKTVPAPERPERTVPAPERTVPAPEKTALLTTATTTATATPSASATVSP
jgi:hypothetical protein